MEMEATAQAHAVHGIAAEAVFLVVTGATVLAAISICGTARRNSATKNAIQNTLNGHSVAQDSLPLPLQQAMPLVGWVR